MSLTAQEVIKSEIKPRVLPEDWVKPEPNEEVYSGNQLIAAYNAGVEKGRTKEQELLQNILRNNVDKAGKHTGLVLEELQKRGLSPRLARLKVPSWDQMNVIIALPEEDYLSKDFEGLYDFVGKLEESERQESYSITFRFCPILEGFDKERLTWDGYTLRHKSLERDELQSGKS